MKTLIKKLFDSSGVELVLRWILGLIFIYASYHKIFDPGQFAMIIQGYDLFPAILIHPLAVVVPYLELFSGLALVFGVYPRGAAGIVSIMLLLFICAISINLIRGHTFDCGCFSFSHDAGVSAVQLLVRDVFYLFMGIQVLFFRGRRRWCLGRTGT